MPHSLGYFQLKEKKHYETEQSGKKRFYLRILKKNEYNNHII